MGCRVSGTIQGIIGHVFTACWESRAQVLLMNRVRKCLIKWPGGNGLFAGSWVAEIYILI